MKTGGRRGDHLGLRHPDMCTVAVKELRAWCGSVVREISMLSVVGCVGVLWLVVMAEVEFRRRTATYGPSEVMPLAIEVGLCWQKKVSK